MPKYLSFEFSLPTDDSFFYQVQNFSDRIKEAKKVQEEKHEKLIVPFVIYNLPNRDCAAGATSGEFNVGYDSMDKYKKFVDSIVDLVKDCTGLDFAVIIEPHALANLVTNRNITRCKEAEDTYIEGIAFAIQRLQLANVAIYLDAAHSGWLGWPKNLKPGMALPRTSLSLIWGVLFLFLFPSPLNGS